ncbi:hypothetical protein AK830_g637 [Neonectria ditissima]|uniref:AB hydrolase-1 domain-containing protein n=1 Tax=Neonectria ditissima TaxID=78410 RepID=A0A0P7BGL9_9HYPO|nr:hypothetical protein AK830_g637 [Neonectria ditissima]
MDNQQHMMEAMDVDDIGPQPAQSASAFDQSASSDALPYGTGSDNTTECDEDRSSYVPGYSQEAPCIRTTFFVNADWRMGSTLANATNIVGQMYVERLDPIEKLHPYPIVLIHGDFHTGQMAKPDGNSGWASYFIRRGYQVFVVDMPPCGRSNFLTGSHFVHRDLGRKSNSLSAAFIERELTAPGKKPAPGQPLLHLKHERAACHNQWPGTGQRGDPIFTNYCASLVTLHLNKVERQSLGQNALQALLHKIGKSILIGEGSGGNMTWLATDVEPNLVAGVVAVEPAGPPFGTAMPKSNIPRVYSQFVERDESTRPYGLTDIPLTYDPPAHPHEGIGPPTTDLLDIDRILHPNRLGACYMQRRPETDVVEVGADGKPLSGGKLGEVRQLIHLKKVPHALVTAHASPHIVFDWATVAYMKQAGVSVDWLSLEKHRIKGNGHLMFLEMNSDEIAGVIDAWIQSKVIPGLSDPRSAGPITPAKSQNMRASEKGTETKSRQGSNGKASDRSFEGHSSVASVRSYEVASRTLSTSDHQPLVKAQTGKVASSLSTTEASRKRPAAPSPTFSKPPDAGILLPGSPQTHDQKRRHLGQGVEAYSMPMNSLPKPLPVPRLTPQQHIRAFQNLQGKSLGGTSPQSVNDATLPPISHSSGPSQLRQQLEAITRGDQPSAHHGPLALPTTSMPLTPQGAALYAHILGTAPVERSSAPAMLPATENEHPRTLHPVLKHITFSDESIRALGNGPSPQTKPASDPTPRTSRQQFEALGQSRMGTPLVDPRLARVSTPVDRQVVHGLTNSPFTPSLCLPTNAGYNQVSGFFGAHATTPPSPSPAPRTSVHQTPAQFRPIPPSDKKPAEQ